MKRRGQAEIIGAVFFVLIAFIALFSIYQVETGFVSTINTVNELMQQQQINLAEKLVQVPAEYGQIVQFNTSYVNSTATVPYLYKLDGVASSGVSFPVNTLPLNISVPFKAQQYYITLAGKSNFANESFFNLYALNQSNKYSMIYSFPIPAYSYFQINAPVSKSYIINNNVIKLLFNATYLYINYDPSKPTPPPKPITIISISYNPIKLSNYTFTQLSATGTLSFTDKNLTTYYPNETNYYLYKNLDNQNSYTFTFNKILFLSSNLRLFLDIYNKNSKGKDTVTVSGYGGTYTAIVKPNNDIRYTIPISTSAISSGTLTIKVSGTETTGIKEAIVQAITPDVIVENTGPYPVQIIRIWSFSNPPVYQNVSIIVQPGQEVNLSRYFTYGSNEIEVVTSTGNVFTFYD